MKILDHSQKSAGNTESYFAALNDRLNFNGNSNLLAPWWLWLAPMLLFSLLFGLSHNGLIIELLFIAAQCAALPALLMACISWFLSRRLNVGTKAGTTLLITLVYGSLVAINVYLMYGPYMAQLLIHANPVDKLIFCVLLTAFSCNLGLASVISLGLIYFNNRDSKA